MAESDDQKIRVLVIDDERFGRAYPRWMLTRRFGVEVLEADSGLKALEVLSQSKVDAIVTDLMMPGLDGLEMLELIRSDARMSDVEMVVASAYSYEQSVRRAIQLGVNDFLIKPFQPAEMEKKFGALIKRIQKNRRLRSDSEAEASKLRVLLADADPNFYSFVASALTGRYKVKQAASALDVVVLISNWNPDLLLLNPKMRGAEVKFLLDQIWGLGLNRGIRVYLLGEESEATEAADQRIGGWVKRNFITEAFSAAITYILEPDTITAQSAVDWLEKLEPEIVSAVRQVFGMMTEVEAVPVKVAEPPACQVFCSLDMSAEGLGLRMLLELGSSSSLAMKLVTKLTGLEESMIDKELLESGVGEVINVVGGRLKESCRSRDVVLKQPLPKVADTPAPRLANSLFDWTRHFQWGSEEIFQLSLACFHEGGM